ncbi:phosphoglucosamine mutase [Amylibacter sp.]|nr:phosphoglucosamine mutase [Amylibacter sp.]MDC0087585.1 phosphoglucosamine mutase [Amylibacter sp.]MDC1292636.1 phosphoglucosamine mutase [Amylibacter sp.]MDC1412203.1 phosphoglucosamine mutase [Amylibacter sp.]MDC1531283.1 phosphoglucosamine mutase [Amylibacter sp.]
MTKRKYFGTDGVRGLANAFPMTPDIALKLGAAAGRHFRKDQKQHRVVIGKDTRRSSYMFENALTAGFTSTGMDVYLLGPVPTPAVGVLTRSMRADVGVMISASHNSYLDNGIKFFGPEGFKLSDKVELEIEKLLDDEIEYAASQNIGMAKRIDDALGRYMEFAKSAFPRKKLLNGLKVVVDCANGAAYKAAPIVLWELGAEVIAIGVNPDGYNINKDCGSTHPQNAAKAVLEHNADVGICLDGDADRLILIDNKGKIADGDQLMGLIASQWSSKGKLANNTLVATVMSNMGLERYLNTLDIKLLRTNVGDRYVVEAMRKFGYNLGGEQSGHIVMTDYATTGDGLMAALQFLNTLVESKCTSSELIKVFEPMPQLLRNVMLNNSESLDNLKVKESIKAGEDAFGDIGRILIRKSGTEPLLRVMGECEDPKLLKAVIGNIVETVDAIN